MADTFLDVIKHLRYLTQFRIVPGRDGAETLPRLAYLDAVAESSIFDKERRLLCIKFLPETFHGEMRNNEVLSMVRHQAHHIRYNPEDDTLIVEFDLNDEECMRIRFFIIDLTEVGTTIEVSPELAPEPEPPNPPQGRRLRF